MTGRHSFVALRARMAPEAQAAALRLGEQMDLAEVKRASKLSQDQIAETLEIGNRQFTGPKRT